MYDGYTRLFKIIDTTKCGFVAEPIVTVTTRGRLLNRLCPTLVTTYVVNKEIWVTCSEDLTVEEAKARQCDVYWSANGYNC